MTVVFTVLFAFAIGFLVRQRGLAVVGYLAVTSIVFTYQSVSVLLSWMAAQPPVAFGPSPAGGFPVTYDAGETWGYGVVNLVVVAAGVGLVLLGGVVARRRAARRVAVAVA